MKKIILLGVCLFSLLIFIPNIYAQETDTIGEYETLEEIVETGTIGEYDTIEEAEEVATNEEVDNEEEKIETSIITEQREYIENSVSFDEIFSTNIGATIATEAFKATYRLLGYDENSAYIETIIITESSIEERTFNSIAEILTYRSLLQASGYDVNIRILNIGLTTRETNQKEIDETFSSILDLLRYLLSLAREHNNFQLRFENNSYTVTIDEDVSHVFETREEAYTYLRNLNNEYEVSNDEVIYNDQPTQIVEHIQEYFETAADAEEAYHNLESTEYSLENKQIRLLSLDEIENDKENIIDALALNKEDVAYSSISTINNNVAVTFEDENGDTINTTGLVRINEVIINDNSYTPLLLTGIALLEVPNNTAATLRGTITTDYCVSYRTIFGARICTSYKTIDFESHGLINIDRNNSILPFDILTDNVFNYSITGYNDVDKSVSDNLINVNRLDVDKVTTYTNPTYTVNAHIHKEDIVRQYRVEGSVSRIDLIPVYTLEINRSKDVERYHAVVDMVKKNVKDVYIVNYVRTLKEKHTNNDQKEDIPTPIETSIVNPITVDIDNVNLSVTNPKTSDSIGFYIVCLALSTIGLAISFKKLNY